MQLAGRDSATQPSDADLVAACDAWVVLVLTPSGKYRRRVLLSLHAAAQAVARAQENGQQAALVLCRLTPESIYQAFGESAA